MKLTTGFRWIYARPLAFPLLSDALTWAGVLVLTMQMGTRLMLIPLAALSMSLIGRALGLYQARWRVSSFEEVVTVGYAWMLTTLILIGAQALFPTYKGRFNFGVLVAAMLSAGLMLGTRVVWRQWWERERRPRPEGTKRTVVFGAGQGGMQIVKVMMSDPDSVYYPVALLDDDRTLENRQIQGVKVEGTREDLQTVAERHNADVVLIAVPTASSKLIHEVTTAAAAAKLEVRVLPATSELVGRMTLSDVRPPTVDDLLGRDPVEIDLTTASDYLTGKRVLITGAGGSIGSELSRQVSLFEPAELYFLDRDESALHALQLSIEGRALLDTNRLVVADIRDRERLMEIFEEVRPHVVFHTAALKHLTLLENHPMEGVKTNTVGTANLLAAAKKFNVERFINISTDKAADPTSVLGATKLAAERMTQVAAQEVGAPYLSVRFGNVLGSRGSVLPTFLDQLETGRALTVTDPEATRYFMTIPEASRLVIQAGAIGSPGEILILDMGEPVKILDLANNLINLLKPGTPVEFTGLRNGEKLHEVLIAGAEVGEARVHPRILHTKAEPADPACALEMLGPHAVERARDMLSQDAVHP